jgi:hypothetical protein
LRAYRPPVAAFHAFRRPGRDPAGGLREDWVHPQYASNSDQYFADRRDCVKESYKGQDGFGEYYSRERFSVCMQARGWRNR